MDTIQTIEEGSEPDESLVPAVLGVGTEANLPLLCPKRIMTFALLCSLSPPLGTRRGGGRYGDVDFRCSRTLRNRVNK